MQLPTHNLRNLAHHDQLAEPPQHYAPKKNSGSVIYSSLRRLGVRLEAVNLRCIRRWLVISLLSWLVYGLYLYSHARSALGSCSFDAGSYRQSLFELEGQRVQHSLRFLSSFANAAKDEAHQDASEPKELCMVITTVDRHGARYLLQSAASVLRGLTEEQRRNSELLIVNADMNDTTPTYESDLDLLRRIPRVKVIKKRDDHPEPIPFSEEEDPFLYWLAKERGDYVYGLDQCRRRKPKYIILFEDDVWAARNWYSRLMNQVEPLDQEWEQRKHERVLRLQADKDTDEQQQQQQQQLIDEEAQRMAGGPPRAVDIRQERPEEKDWAVVKLYMAQQYDQFDLYLNNDDIALFVSWGVGWGLFAIAAYVAYLFFARWRQRGLTRRTDVLCNEGGLVSIVKDWRAVIANDWNTLLCLFFIVNIVPAAVLFPVCVTKQNFFATRKADGIHMTKSRCCAQAQFFKNDAMFDQMVSCINMNDYRLYPLGVDLLVSDCARGVGGVVYETIPHLFQHIGIHSSSSVKRKHQDHHAWLPHMSVYFEEEE
jgi:hypothetical protein